MRTSQRLINHAPCIVTLLLGKLTTAEMGSGANPGVHFFSGIGTAE
jgi:hypothetical protein